MYQIFIGIDQTGATNSKGIPRPLQVCLIQKNKNDLKIFESLQIDKLNQDNLIHLIQSKVPNFKKQKVLVCVDSVLGLPNELKVSFNSVIQDVRNFSYKNKKYGALTAFHFFNQYLSKNHIPNRQVEELVKANSVFKLKPFQKNIGCGTYRILKDLSEEKKWFSVWPFEPTSMQFTLAEGYPSFFWKKYFKQSKRNHDYLKVHFPQLKFKNLDQADSFVLAYGASYEKLIPIKNSKYEGWILGVPHE